MIEPDDPPIRIKKKKKRGLTSGIQNSLTSSSKRPLTSGTKSEVDVKHKKGLTSGSKGLRKETTIRIPEKLMNWIDSYCGDAGINRNDYFVERARKHRLFVKKRL